MSVSAPGDQTAVAQRDGDEEFRGYTPEVEEELSPSGGIPLCLRIGVTGHRDISNPVLVKAQVTEALRWLAHELRLSQVSRRCPIWLQVLTPLAAGADQIVAEAVLDLPIPGITLKVPVPEDENSYKESIRQDSTAALAVYERLSSPPGRLTKLPGTVADDAGFRKLGEWVVNHCDVLVALWDGQPPPPSSPAGAPPGAASIVSYALSNPREIPVIVIPVARESASSEQAGNLPPRQLLMRVEHANPFLSLWWRLGRVRGRKPVGLHPLLSDPLDVVTQQEDGQATTEQRERQAEFEQSIRSWRLEKNGRWVLRRNVLGVSVRHVRRFNAHLNPRAKNGFIELVDNAVGSSVGAIPAAARKIGAWAHARYLRADALAGRYQRISRWLDRSIYLLAALSVIAAATRAIWATPGSALALGLTYLDVFLLAVVSAILVADVRGRLRDEWVSFRGMAEYLRTYMFLALIDESTDTSASEYHPSLTSLGLNEFVGPAWFDRVMQAIWLHRPDQPTWTEDDLPALKAVLCGWLADQQDYHDSKERSHAKWHRRFLIAVASLFIVTVLAALVHLFASGDRIDDWLNFVAIGVPGFAAAINSIAAAGEHHRHSVRSRAAKHRLSYEYLPAIKEAESLEVLRKKANILGNYILGETTDWYEVMAVHSVDIPT
jgi:hypothetical protein